MTLMFNRIHQLSHGCMLDRYDRCLNKYVLNCFLRMKKTLYVAGRYAVISDTFQLNFHNHCIKKLIPGQHHFSPWEESGREKQILFTSWVILDCQALWFYWTGQSVCYCANDKYISENSWMPRLKNQCSNPDIFVSIWSPKF